MSTVIMHNVVSVDGFIADANDRVGPLFEWYGNGDVAVIDGGQIKVSQSSADYVKTTSAGRRSPSAWSMRWGWTSCPWSSALASGTSASACCTASARDPDTVIRGNRVLHLRYRVRR